MLKFKFRITGNHIIQCLTVVSERSKVFMKMFQYVMDTLVDLKALKPVEASRAEYQNILQKSLHVNIENVWHKIIDSAEDIPAHINLNILQDK